MYLDQIIAFHHGDPGQKKKMKVIIFGTLPFTSEVWKNKNNITHEILKLLILSIFISDACYLHKKNKTVYAYSHVPIYIYASLYRI